MCKAAMAVFWSIVFLVGISDACAIDLQVADLQVLKVGPCSHQLRFGVRSSSTAASDGSVDYRVGVYSARRKTLLHSVDIRGQKLGTTHAVVIPADKLTCDSSIEIRIDDQNQVADTDRQNNVTRESWQAPSKTGFCVAQLERCP